MVQHDDTTKSAQSASSPVKSSIESVFSSPARLVPRGPSSTLVPAQFPRLSLPASSTSSSAITRPPLPGAGGLHTPPHPSWHFPKGPVRATAPIEKMSAPPAGAPLSSTATVNNTSADFFARDPGATAEQLSHHRTATPPAAAAVPVRKPPAPTKYTTLFASHESVPHVQERTWRDKLRPEGLQLGRPWTPTPVRQSGVELLGVSSSRPSSTLGGRTMVSPWGLSPGGSCGVTRTPTPGRVTGGAGLVGVLTRHDGPPSERTVAAALEGAPSSYDGAPSDANEQEMHGGAKRLSRSPASPVLPRAEEDVAGLEKSDIVRGESEQTASDLDPPVAGRRSLCSAQVDQGILSSDRASGSEMNNRTPPGGASARPRSPDQTIKPPRGLLRTNRNSASSSTIPSKPLVRPPSLARPASTGKFLVPRHAQPTWSSAARRSSSVRSLSELSNKSYPSNKSRSPLRTIERRGGGPPRGPRRSSPRRSEDESFSSLGAEERDLSSLADNLPNRSDPTAEERGDETGPEERRRGVSNISAGEGARGRTAASHHRRLTTSLPRNKLKIWNPADGRGANQAGGLSPKVVSPTSVLSPARIIRGLSPMVVPFPHQIVPLLPTMLPGGGPQHLPPPASQEEAEAPSFGTGGADASNAIRNTIARKMITPVENHDSDGGGPPEEDGARPRDHVVPDGFNDGRSSPHEPGLADIVSGGAPEKYQLVLAPVLAGDVGAPLLSREGGVHHHVETPWTTKTVSPLNELMESVAGPSAASVVVGGVVGEQLAVGSGGFGGSGGFDEAGPAGEETDLQPAWPRQHPPKPQDQLQRDFANCYSAEEIIRGTGATDPRPL